MTDKMSVPDYDHATQETAIGMLNGCGLGAVLWTVIILTWRFLL